MMDGTNGRGQAVLLADGVEFDDDDAALLRAIDRTGSVAKASSELGRSRARALSRIETLEAAFGDLVERRRGGSGGGGSQITETGRKLLGRYDRLAAAIAATAQVPETVLRGKVTGTVGELADLETDLGVVRGLHNGVTAGDRAQARIGADAVTIHDPADDPEPDSTSARNRLRGSVTAVDPGETVLTASIDVAGTVVRALLTDDSAKRLGVAEGSDVVLTWKATATRVIREPEA